MKNMSLEKIAQACGGVYHGSEEMKQSIPRTFGKCYSR